MIKKPEFLKTRAEKRRDNQLAVIGLCVSMVDLAVIVKRNDEAAEKRRLERENLELRNQLLKKQIEETGD